MFNLFYIGVKLRKALELYQTFNTKAQGILYLYSDMLFSNISTKDYLNSNLNTCTRSSMPLTKCHKANRAKRKKFVDKKSSSVR